LLSVESYRRLSGLLLTIPWALGCGSVDAEDGGDADTRKELARAIETVRASAEYVSFDYSADGCHDRSILLSAELAAAGIASNAQFIVAGEALLTPRQYPDLEWSYHVVPVIFTDGATGADAQRDERKFLRIVDGAVEGDIDDSAYVLDPALYPDDIAAPLATWVMDMTGQGQSAFLALEDAREALDLPQDEADAIARSDAVHVVTSIDDMPQHWGFQPSSSCSFLAGDAALLDEDLGQEGVDAIRRDLNS